MPRRVFYSFHYDGDAWRTQQVRNIGAIDGSKPASANDWEAVKRGGDAAIERWIKGQLEGRTCTVVLIGAQTAGRKWIEYEITESWNRGLGVVGIHVHRLKDQDGAQSARGDNPFRFLSFQDSRAPLSTAVKAYDPPYAASKDAYDHIASNVSSWIEEAIRIRALYS